MVMNRLAIIAVTGALALMLTACDETKETTKTETIKMEKPKAGEAGKAVKEESTTTNMPTTTTPPAEKAPGSSE
jgi:ABC-type uncharacterized transport system auxiliary subunit